MPEGFHLIERHVLEAAVLRLGLLLDVVEAMHELEVGLLQGIVGANLVETCGITSANSAVCLMSFTTIYT